MFTRVQTHGEFVSGVTLVCSRASLAMESVAIRTSSSDSADVGLMFRDSEYTYFDLMCSDSGRKTTDPTPGSSEQEEHIPTAPMVLRPEERSEPKEIPPRKGALILEIQRLKEELREAMTELEGLETSSKTLQKSGHVAMGREKFNMDPKMGIVFLVENELLLHTSEDIAQFLFKGEGLSKTAIGDYLGERNDFNIEVLKAFADLHEFTDLNLQQALRQFLWSFRLPGEAQKIDRMMETFAQRYCHCNPGVFQSTDTCYVLSLSVIMLNTCLHNPNVRDKPTVKQFISMNRGINDGGDLPKDLLKNLYDSIKKEPFKIPEDDGNDQGFAENQTKKKKKTAMGAFLSRKWKAIKRSVRFASESVDIQDPADLRPGSNSLGCVTLNSNNQTDPEPLSISSPSTLDSGIAPTVEKQSKRRVKKNFSSFIQRTWKSMKVSTLRSRGGNTVDPGPANLQTRTSVLSRDLTEPGPSHCEVTSDPLSFPGPSHREITPDPLPFPGPSFHGSQSAPLSLDSPLDLSLFDLLSEFSFILGPSIHKVTAVPSSSSLKLADPEPKPVPEASGLWSATEEFSSFYEVKAELGAGDFGTMFEGTRRCDGQKVAIKFRPKKFWDKMTNLPGATKPLPMEVAVNMQMRKSPKSPHIVQMLDWFAEPEQLILIMEHPHLCETLLRFTQRNGGSLDEAVARGLMRQAVLASKHCIHQGVFHQDIMADGILVNTETLQLAFIDFSCCGLFKTCEGRDWAVKSTVWSLGRVLLEIASGSQPLINLQSGKLDPLRPTLSKECCDLIKQCLDNNESKRPTLEQMLEHAWFEQD